MACSVLHFIPMMFDRLLPSTCYSYSVLFWIKSDCLPLALFFCVLFLTLFAFCLSFYAWQFLFGATVASLVVLMSFWSSFFYFPGV